MTVPKKQITAIIAGAGGRGTTYAQFAQEHPDRLRIVGVAEPREWNRQHLVNTYNLPAENVYSDWRDLAARPRFADMVIIATQDAMHVDPAVAFAQKGYAMLLEKPMAPNEADCKRIIQAVKEDNILFGVCHVMRYTRYTQMLKQVVDSGAIGEVVSVQHLEPVGYWHQAHSFVRGNWRNETESSFMLLAKSCHDLDWLRYIVGEPCRSVSSFGSLEHFKKSAKPAGAGDATRCLHCAYEPRCPYSAKKIYIEDRLSKGYTGWPVDVLTPEPTLETVTAALENGPYGRCVYECDNDVVDHQVVNLLYENGATASFTMIGASQHGDRQTAVFGTLGELRGDLAKIAHYDYMSGQTEIIHPVPEDVQQGGHWDGDINVLKAFIHAVATGDRSGILSGAEETLETHLTVFAAEESRREGRTVRVVL